jgi:tetratricopeptide (TPR) repeat protein
VANAFWSYLLYLLKAVWPLHLVIFYPHPEKTIGFAKPLLAALFLVAFMYFCFRHLQQRYLLAGWLWYLGCLVPVIGFVQVGRQAMADRYPYVPLIGIFVLVVWWIAENSSRLPQRSEILAGVTVLFLIFFAGLTWRQTTYWKNSFTVFRHALEITPVNFIAENNLGQAYVDIGKSDLAYDHFLRSTQEKPYFGLAHYNLGVVLIGQNRRADARREFQLAIKYGQDATEIASAYHNLGIAMLEDDELVDARIALSEALRLVPNKQSSYLARGLVEFKLADYSSAEADFVKGANLAPDPAAAYWVGRSREAQGNTNGAIDAYRRTLAMQPNMTEAKEHLDALLSGHTLPFSKPVN